MKTMTQEETYQCQLQRVGVWENYWQQRLKTVQTPPPPSVPTTLLLGISRAFQRRIKALEAQLTGTLFDPAKSEAQNHADRAALKCVPRTFGRDLLLDCDLTWLRTKYQLFERGVNLSLDEGATAEQAVRHYLKSCEWFCKAGEPVLMQQRLLATGQESDIWPMLAGLATAYLSTPKMSQGRRVKRQEALEEIFWQTHSKQQHPSPTSYQLQAVLQEQALIATPQLVPMQTLGQVSCSSVNKLLQFREKVVNGAAFNIHNPQHLSLLLELDLLSVQRFQSWLDQKPKTAQKPALLLGRASAIVLLNLPAGVDRFVLAQKSRPVFYESEMHNEDAPADDFITNRPADDIGIEARFLMNEEINAALNSLKPSLRETLLLDIEGWTDEQIAQHTCQPIETVKKQLYRFRKTRKTS